MNRRTFIVSSAALVTAAVLLPRAKATPKKMQRVRGRDCVLIIAGHQIHAVPASTLDWHT